MGGFPDLTVTSQDFLANLPKNSPVTSQELLSLLSTDATDAKKAHKENNHIKNEGAPSSSVALNSLYVGGPSPSFIFSDVGPPYIKNFRVGSEMGNMFGAFLCVYVLFGSLTVDF